MRTSYNCTLQLKPIVSTFWKNKIIILKTLNIPNNGFALFL